MAAQLYIQDYDDGFPPAFGRLSEPTNAVVGCPQSRIFDAWWGELLRPYTRSAGIFQCPSSRGRVKVGAVENIWNNTCVAPTPTPAPVPAPTAAPAPTPSGSSCAAVPAHVIDPAYYSYAFNAINNNTIFWSHSSGLGANHNGFSSNGLSISCVVKWYASPITSQAVLRPDSTIFIADGEIGDGTLVNPQFIADDNLDYANTSLRRLARRHHDGFNALFADGHVKWQLVSRPAQWTVQDD